MSKTAIIKWNSESIANIKNNLLFFDDLYYDPYLYLLYNKLFENVAKLLKHESDIPNQIIATQKYLKNKSILKEFDFNSFKKNPNNFKGISQHQANKIIKEVLIYDNQHKSFLNNYEQAVELLSKDYQNGLLKFTQLFEHFEHFADSHLRISRVFLELKNNEPIIPLVTNIQNAENDNKYTTIRFVLDKLPTPSENIPLNEVIDFKNENKRKYLELIQWVNKLLKENINQHDLFDEYEYLNCELAESVKVFNQHKSLDKVEIFLKIPFEIVENIIKINLSKIPGLFVDIQRNKLLNYEKEYSMSGKEIAYIFKANKVFKTK